VNSRQDQQLAFRLSSWATKRKKSVDLLPDCRNIKKETRIAAARRDKRLLFRRNKLGKGKYG
jgi:hypothetical protein